MSNSISSSTCSSEKWGFIRTTAGLSLFGSVAIAKTSDREAKFGTVRDNIGLREVFMLELLLN